MTDTFGFFSTLNAEKRFKVFSGIVREKFNEYWWRKAWGKDAEDVSIMLNFGKWFDEKFIAEPVCEAYFPLSNSRTWGEEAARKSFRHLSRSILRYSSFTSRSFSIVCSRTCIRRSVLKLTMVFTNKIAFEPLIMSMFFTYVASRFERVLVLAWFQMSSHRIWDRTMSATLREASSMINFRKAVNCVQRTFFGRTFVNWFFQISTSFLAIFILSISTKVIFSYDPFQNEPIFTFDHRSCSLFAFCKNLVLP